METCRHCNAGVHCLCKGYITQPAFEGAVITGSIQPCWCTCRVSAERIRRQMLKISAPRDRVAA